MQNLLASAQSIVSQFLEVSDSLFSIVFLSIFALLSLVLIIANFSSSLTYKLKKYHILEAHETPFSFLIWIWSVMIIIRAIQVFVLQPFLVDGASMFPTFTDNNLLIVDKTYKYRTINRDDVIVFKFEKEGSTYNGRYFIKRVIGLPGDTVSVDNKKTVVIDKAGKNVSLPEDYVKYPKLVQHVSIKLGNDEYFVMGDNRDGSYDSRAWGPIHISQIAGEPLLQLYPNVAVYPGAVR